MKRRGWLIIFAISESGQVRCCSTEVLDIKRCRIREYLSQLLIYVHVRGYKLICATETQQNSKSSFLSNPSLSLFLFDIRALALLHLLYKEEAYRQQASFYLTLHLESFLFLYSTN